VNDTGLFLLGQEILCDRKIVDRKMNSRKSWAFATHFPVPHFPVARVHFRPPLPIPPQLSGIGSIHRIIAAAIRMFRIVSSSGRTVRFVMIRTSVTF